MTNYVWPPNALTPNDRLDKRLEQCAIEDRFSPDLLIAEAIAARTSYLKLLHDLGLLGEQDSWLPLGPSSLLSGQAQHNLELAGRVLDLKLSADGLRAYIATDNGGVWYTSDAGRSWSPLGSWGLRGDRMAANRSINALTVNALEVHFGATADQDVVYAATGDPRPSARSAQPGASFRGVGVFRLDGAVTSALANPGNIPWKREGVNLAGLGIHRLSHDPSADLAFAETGANTLVAATTNGLYQRTGAFVENADWTRVTGVDPFTFNAADGVACTDVLWTPATTAPVRPARLWVALTDPHGARTDVYVSSNGTTGPFQRVNLPGRGAGSRLGIASAPGHPEIVYILGKQANHQARVWRVDVDTDLTARVVNNVPIGLFGKVTAADDGTLQVQHDQADYDLAICVDSDNPEIIYVGGSLAWAGGWTATLHKLTLSGTAASDNFQTDFLPAKQTDPASDSSYMGHGVFPNIHTIVHISTGIWVGSDGGVFAQADGTMRPRNSGLATIGPGFIDSHPTLDGPLIAGIQGLGCIERVGDTVWRIWVQGDGGGVAYHANKPFHYIGQRTNAFWQVNSGNFSPPILRTTGSPEGMANSERRENDSAGLYSNAAVAAGADGKSRIAVGSNRVWFSHDWDPDATANANWVTLPSGTDPRASGATPSDDQDILRTSNNADWVVTLKWSRLGTETDGRFDGQCLLVLTHQTIRQYTYDAAQDKWSAHNFTDEKKKNRVTSNGDITDGASEQLPRIGQWTDIAPHDPGRGSHGSFYVSTTGKAEITDTGALHEADKMDTLWWFDGTDKWYPTGLRNTAANTTTGTGGSKAPAFAVVCDGDSPNTVYVGNAVGVWRGTLSFSGSTPSWEWRGLLQGLPLAAARGLSIHCSGSLKLLRVALQSRGVWELDISTTRTSVGRTYLRAHDLDMRRTPLTGSLVDPLTTNTPLDLAQSPDVYARPAGAAPPWGAGLPTEADLFNQTNADSRRDTSQPPGNFEVYVQVHHRHIQPLPGSNARVLLLQLNDAPDDLTTVTLDLPWRQAVMALFDGTSNAAPPGWIIADSGTPIRSPDNPIDARTPRAVRFDANLGHDFATPTTTQDSCLLLALVSSNSDPIALTDLDHANYEHLIRNNRHVATRRVVRGGSACTLTVLITGTSTPLENTWIYISRGTSITRFRTDGSGIICGLSAGQDPDDPNSYNANVQFQCSAELDICTSVGIKPLPVIELQASLTCFLRVSVQQTGTSGSANTGSISVPDIQISITQPAELSLWVVLWEPEEDAWLTQGIPQGAPLWAGGAPTITENGQANIPGPNRPVPMGVRARPSERGLLIKGTIDGSATAAKIRIIDSHGRRLQLKSSRDDTAHIDELSATLAAASAGLRNFEQVIYFNDTSSAFGPIYIVVETVGISPSPTLGSFFVHFSGLQISLVNDYSANANGQLRGPILSEADEVNIIDFENSPQANLNLITAQTRGRRMIRYPITHRNRALSSTVATIVQKPEMPLWMAECQIVGITKEQIEYLIRIRSNYISTANRNMTFTLNWKINFSWDGPDSGTASTRRYQYSENMTATQTFTLSLDAGNRIANVDSDGRVVGALSPSPTAPSFPVAGRRIPALFISGQTRAWSRMSDAQLKSSLIMEWQPLLTNGAGNEIMRGGDGVLKLISLEIEGERVDSGKILPSGGPLSDLPATAGNCELPKFRIYGENPPLPADALINTLVEEYFNNHSTANRVSVLTLACWQDIIRRILAHESAGRGQFDTRGAGRRRFSGTYYGHEGDMPIFGPPHGYGYGQHDNPPVSDDGAWSFFENLRESVRRVMEDKAQVAYNHLSTHIPSPIDQRFRATFQREVVRRYNGGREFSWSGGQWRIDPSLACGSDRLDYPNNILGTAVVYFTAGPGGAPVCTWPITFTAAMFGPET